MNKGKRKCIDCKKMKPEEDMGYNLDNNDGDWRDLGGICDVYVPLVYLSGPYCYDCWDRR